jgi:hypothetical protein
MMCSISLFTADELFQVAAELSSKGKAKEAFNVMGMAIKLKAQQSKVN